MYCINASNGSPMWSIMGYYNPTAIAEGALFATNSYDSCSYAFAKGETATTVAVTPEVVADRFQGTDEGHGYGHVSSAA